MNKTSVLIPTLNAGSNWITLLESIKNQNVVFDKLIIIDSGSTDKTVQYAKDFGFTVLTIKKENFDHGYARMLLSNAAEGSDILVYLTQDCILADADSIRNLIAVFDDDKVALAYGRQLPHKGAKILESHARLFNYPDKSVIKKFEDRSELGIKTTFSSNSFAAFRKVALDEIGGFAEKSISGEEIIAGAKLLKKGWKVAYVAESKVYHSHDYTILEEFKRYFDIGVFDSVNQWMLDDFGKAYGEGLKYIQSEFKYVLKNNILVLPKMGFSFGAKFLGYKLGLRHSRFSKSTNRKLSMHKKYWNKV